MQDPTAASRWAGSWLTLRFQDPAQEKGFLRYYSALLARSAFILVLVTTAFPVIALILTVLWWDTSLLSHDGMLVFKVKVGLLVVYVLAATATMVCFRVERLLQCIGFAQREIIVTILATLLTFVFALSDTFYCCKMLGFDPYTDLLPVTTGPYTDTALALVLANITAALHLAMPIRWYISVSQEAATVLVYGGCTMGLGGPIESAQQRFRFVAFLSCLVFLTAIGKRQIERTERAMFARLVAERTLRTQAEFQLSTLDQQPRDALNDGQSFVSTTPSGALFRRLESSVFEEHLTMISRIGRGEQWLIGEEELQVFPNQLLGQGSFGAVVAGLFHSTPVALKFPLLSRGSRAPADIGNELRILRRLRHPNIVMFHGACINFEHQNIALVLECVKGILMANYIGSSADLAPSSEARAQCVVGVCRALMYLHSRLPRIVHGDIKPENIMVEHHSKACSSCGSCCQVSSRAFVNAKLLDFGLSRVQTRHTKPLGGTLRWAAPEVFSRREVLPQPAADVYSFGCLVYFAATEELPLASWPHKAIAIVKRHGARVTLQHHNRLFLKSGWPLVEKATHHQPQQRPTMSELHEEISQWPEYQLHGDARAELTDACWQAIERLQETLTAQHDSPQLQTGSRTEQQQGQQPRQGQQPQQVEEQPALNQAQCLAVNMDTPDAVRCPGFIETPMQTRLLDVIVMLHRWNVQIPRMACCDYHAVVGYLPEVQQLLLETVCKSMDGDNETDGQRVQCPECFALNLKSDDSVSFRCECCGCNDGPLQEQGSIPRLPPGAARDEAVNIQAQHGNSHLAPLRITCSL